MDDQFPDDNHYAIAAELWPHVQTATFDEFRQIVDVIIAYAWRLSALAGDHVSTKADHFSQPLASDADLTLPLSDQQA